MYLSSLKLWNFRQFGKNSDDLNLPADLSVEFKMGLNLLVGENDSGKSSIVDAINYIVVPYSHEYLRISTEDFHNSQKKMKIECEFTGFSVSEAKNFIEYLTIKNNPDGAEQRDVEKDKEKWVKENIYNLSLKLYLETEIKGEAVGWYDLKAGADEAGIIFRGEVRDLLRSMYLKPLRNAKHELKAQSGSRLSQILSKHKNFTETVTEHPLKEIFKHANAKIQAFFKGFDIKDGLEVEHPDKRGKATSDEIHIHLKKLFSTRQTKSAKFDISELKLDQVLQKLSLELDEKRSGLGALNILFIAVELLLLKRTDHSGLHLGIIEEAEAHLHTQAQMRVLMYLQTLSEDISSPIQLILTTHSPQIASAVHLRNLILINKGTAFPMDENNTELDKSDYGFLERFLDATKANLFFAEGVILVEGDAENLLIPTIARLIDRDLVQYGVSIVNVGHTGLFRYSRIFLRKHFKDRLDTNHNKINIPVACIKDNDCKYYIDEKTGVFMIPSAADLQKSRDEKAQADSEQNVKSFVSENKTLEFDIALDIYLRKDFYRAVLYANKAKNAVGNIYINNEKQKDADQQVTSDFEAWEKNQYSIERIAHEIYHCCKDNKSLTAQFFAQILVEKMEDTLFVDCVKNSPKLKYIISAIEHVTASLPASLDS